MSVGFLSAYHEDAPAQIARSLYHKIYHDDLLKRYFDLIDHSHMRQQFESYLREIGQIHEALVSEQLVRIHKNSGISSSEYDRFLDLFKQSLEEAGIKDADCQKALNSMRNYRPMIVQEDADSSPQ